MKKCAIVLIGLFTTESFCVDIQSKGQMDMKSESDLNDRYGWTRPSIQQQWPTQKENFNPNQWSNSNALNRRPPNQGGFPLDGYFPNQDRFRFRRPYPNQGRFTFDSPYANEGKFTFDGPYSNQGRSPFDGPYPNLSRFPFDRPYPNQVTFPFGVPHSNQGRFPFGGPFSNDGRFPFDNSNQGFLPTQQPTTQRPIQRSTTPGENSVKDCLQNCPVTSEYNPVCGTNKVTYPNAGRLMCAQACGITVKLLRSSPCPTLNTVAPI